MGAGQHCATQGGICCIFRSKGRPMKRLTYHGYNAVTVIFLVTMALNIFLIGGYEHFKETQHCSINASLKVLTNTRIENIDI